MLTYGYNVAPKHDISKEKLKIPFFLGRDTALSPDLTTSGKETPFPTTHSLPLDQAHCPLYFIDLETPLSVIDATTRQQQRRQYRVSSNSSTRAVTSLSYLPLSAR